MKNLALLFILILAMSCKIDNQEAAVSWKQNALKNLPQPVTNNAVSEGFIDGKPFVYSFGGLDSTKLYKGIHLRSYRLDVLKNQWEQIVDLPDTLGKIASAASRINDTIYIIGGYHVFSDGSERSSAKVHRYDIINNRFLNDGAAIPVAIDDQVQAVWRNSLIYVITGWSDKENVPNVQIYDPVKNSWTAGTPVPNDHVYKSFGASGTIIGDTIYYFGGASMGKHYPIQNIFRKGVVNDDDPRQIKWSHQILDSSLVGYRMGVTSVKKMPHWIGGSDRTYNYNAIAYDGSSGVKPLNRDLYYEKGVLKRDFSNKFPMDLRGIAQIEDSVKIIVGGINEDQQVSNRVYKIVWEK